MTTKSNAAVLDSPIDTNIKWRSNDKPRTRRAIAAVVTALALLTLTHFGHQRKPASDLTTPPPSRQHFNQTPNQPFRWADIPPSRTLTWHPCFLTATTPSSTLDCARLDVPLDWLSPSDDHRVTLAVIRLRASAPDKTAHRGPIVFNPGGPGGSGIWALRDHGRDLQAIVGGDYDIVSFDPRGVGASTPRLDCWGGRATDRALWELQEVGVVDAHPGVLNDAYARAGAFSRVCEERLGEGGLLRFSSTASSARDMREVMEQMGERRLKYWGFSYGTVLGGTFAAMYPGLVERMVCDGNVDYNEWYHNKHINFLRDADRVMDSFYFHCHRAGPLRCAFHAATPGLIRDRLDTLLDTLRTTPVLVPPVPSETDDTPSLPELITYSKAKRMIATALYQPILRFPSIAVVLAGLERGDGTPYQSYTALDGPSSPLPLCRASPTSPPADPDTGDDGDTPDAFSAVLCADAPAWNDTLSSFSVYAAALQTMSRASGAVNVASRLSCAGRGGVRAKWRFAGPFAGVETWHPLLFVANEADNVTPLVSARNNSAGFVGSRVLVQRGSAGHTSLAAGSRCTAGVVRGYFREGRMPAEGEECVGDGVPFGEEEVGGVGEDEVGRAVGRLVGDRRWVGGLGG